MLEAITNKTPLSIAKELLAFALPMTMTATNAVVTSVIDTVMVGQLGVNHLAAIAIASSIYLIVVIIGRGFSQALAPLLSAEIAQSRKPQKILSHGILISICTGLVVCPFLLLLANSLELLGQDRVISGLASVYLNLMTLFVLPIYLMQAIRTGIEANGDSKFPMLASLFTSLLNIFLNWILIFGNLGAPRLELTGAAIASGIANVTLLIVLAYYLNWQYGLVAFRKIKEGIDLALTKKILKIGGLFSFQWCIEVGAFSASTLIVGYFSKVHLAAHQIVLNVTTLTFMIPLGLGAASTIKVSAALKNLGPAQTEKLVKIYLYTCWLATFLTSAGILIVRNFVPQLYTDSPEVISLAGSILVIAAMFQLADGTQAVVSGILRGYLDIKAPTWIITISWWGLTMPLAYYLVIEAGLGAHGMWYGLTFGLVLSACLLTIRLKKVFALSS